MVNERYISYLRSEDWKIRRKELLDEANHLCSECGDKATQLHHLKYNNLGFEILGVDVIAICKRCHEDTHMMKGRMKGYGEYKAYY